ncbi:MAG: hypothetical protein RL071_1332 [Pseudomonadota bacterium]
MRTPTAPTAQTAPPAPAPVALRLLRLARPRMWAPLIGLLLFGWGLGHWTLAAPLTGLNGLLQLILAWTCLHAGALWLNAVRDQDDGPVLFGGPPAPPPAVAGPLSGLALLACPLLAAPAGVGPALCALGCAALAVAYSHPAAAWKGHPLAGPLTNAVGYGALTPLAGYLLVGRPDDPRLPLALLGCALTMASLSFAAMVWQGPADAARGDRTLAATHGAVGALRAARLCLALAGVPVVMGALWGLFPRVVLVGAALLPWADAPLRAWQRAAEPGDPAAGPARALVYLRRLGRLCLACLGCALIDYLWDDLHGRALAGRGTAWTPTLPVEEAP